MASPTGPRAGAAPSDGRSPHPPLLEVGTVVKPHGLRGAVVVALSTNRTERVESGSDLTGSNGRVLHVVRSAPHHARYLVWFEGVTDIEAAEELRGVTLAAPPLDDPDALWIHELIGADVFDLDGHRLGTVEAVEANPASDLLVLAGGALVPLRFVVDADPGVRVTVDVPEGLLDLG